MEDLISKMNAEYSSHKNIFSPTNLEQDPYCAVLCGVDTWCRVRILGPIDENNFSAVLVDYGTEAEVSADCLQPLWPQFRVLPKMAARVCLAGDVFDT